MERASAHLTSSFISEPKIAQRIEFIGRNPQNKALSRLILACCLAKVHRPDLDARKPYTEIGDNDAFSGRTYDESFIGPFVYAHSLPCNPTTAFLTPTLRNRNTVLTPQSQLVGRPPALYTAALQLLEDVQNQSAQSEDVLAELVRVLLVLRHENQSRLATLLAGAESQEDAIPLSVETIVGLVESHLKGRYGSRLPVLVVAAAYETAGELIGERARPLQNHNAADRQTGALGDLEIVLTGEDRVVTGYEMKTRRVTREDVDVAIQKILAHNLENYLFITTEPVTPEVADYARSLYEKTGGVEIAILDCLSFLRHFLHLFHRLRARYVEEYQRLILQEPESGVAQPLKELWLALRSAAESDLGR